MCETKNSSSILFYVIVLTLDVVPNILLHNHIILLSYNVEVANLRIASNISILSKISKVNTPD